MRVTLSTDGDSYNIYFNNDIETSSQHSNILQIQSDVIQAIDGSDYHDCNVLYMMDAINKLEKAELKRLNKTSAGEEKESYDREAVTG
jgi:hypothetical protein